MTLPFAEPLHRARAWIAGDQARALADRLAPYFIFAVALSVRLAFVEEHPPRLYVVDDMAFYDASARRLLDGTQTAWDSFTPVGYPALLAATFRVGGDDAIGALQAIVGALACVLAWALTKRLVRGFVAPLLVGLAIAFYLPLVLYTGLLMTETIFSCGVLAFVWLLTIAVARNAELDSRGTPRSHASTAASAASAIAAGLVFGAAAVIRPNLLLAVPLLALLAVALRRRAGLVRSLAVAALAASLPIAVASIHQSRLVERPALLATNGGLNFFLGHCECRAVRFPPGNKIIQVAGHHNRARYEELAYDDGPAYDERRFYQKTFDLLERDPARLARDLSNVADGLGVSEAGAEQPFWPGWMGHNAALRGFGQALLWLGLAPATAYAIALIVGRRLAEGWTGFLRVLLWLLFGSAILTNYLFLGDPRIRVSFDPIVMVLAAEAWVAALGGAAARLRLAR